MLRKVILLLCITITVFCYGWPCFVLPFGTYSATVGEETVSYEFSFNGTVTRRTSEEVKNGVYQLDFANKAVNITISGEEVDTMALTNVYQFGDYWNPVGQYIMLGVAILAVVVVVILPNGYND